MTNTRRRQKKPVKIFLDFTYLHKTQLGQNDADNFANFLKDSFLEMCRYLDLYYAHTNRFCFVVVQENIKPEVLKVQTELARPRPKARPCIVL